MRLNPEPEPRKPAHARRVSGSTQRPHAGFTLAELAIVLCIVGLLLGLLMPSLNARSDQQQRAESRQALAEAREALLGFAAATGRLPRPAVSFADGQEGAAVCNDDEACTGFIPWQVLGIRKTDGWNKLIRYSVSPALTSTGFTLEDITTRSNKKIQSRDDSGALTYLVGSASACSSTPCAAAVIYSAGKNNWGTLETGVSVGDQSETNHDEDNNANATTTFIARDPGTLPGGGEFDDLVIWLPATILSSRLVAAGRLP